MQIIINNLSNGVCHWGWIKFDLISGNDKQTFEGQCKVPYSKDYKEKLLKDLLGFRLEELRDELIDQIKDKVIYITVQNGSIKEKKLKDNWTIE